MIMRYSIIFLLILSTFAVAEPYFITTGGVEDHGFDEELVSSNFPDWIFSGSGSFIREEYREYDGDSYAIIDASTSGDNYFYQDILSGDLLVGKTYILSFRYKILGDDLTVSTGGGARVKLAINEGFLSGTVYAATKPVTEETGDNWGVARLAFTARSEDSRLSVGMWGATGKLCIDDVRINVMEEAVGGTLVNPDFEPLGAVGPSPFGWTATPGMNGTITTVDDGIRSGSGAADITRTSFGGSTLAQTITIDNMTRYQGHIYVYTDDANGTGASFSIIQNKQIGTETLFTAGPYEDDNAWHRVPIDFTTVDNGTTIKYELKLQGPGTARFDGLFIRMLPIMAGDFEDPDWDDYWIKEATSPGTASRGNDPASIGNNVLEIENSGNSDTTTVYQDFAAIEATPYLYNGRLRLDNLSSISMEDYGAYVRLYDRENEVIVDEAGPYTAEDEWIVWGLSAPPDPVANPTISDRYRIRCVLENTSGTLLIDDVNCKTVSSNDWVSVIPQPALADRTAGYSVIPDPDSTWLITYQSSPGNKDTNPIYRCALDLEEDMQAGSETNFDHYFHIPSADLTLKTFTLFNPDIEKPAIMLLGLSAIGSIDQEKINRILVEAGVTKAEINALGEEGYVLITYQKTIDGEGYPRVLIASAGNAGRYYGTQTFLQLLSDQLTAITPHYDPEQPSNRKTFYIPDVEIYDTPEMPIRAAHLTYPIEYKFPPSDEDNFKNYQYKMGLLIDRVGDDDRPPLEVYARLLSRMKMNMLIVSSPIYYCLEENSGTESKKNYQHMQRLYDFCRRYYIEPVPEMQSFGHAKNVLQFIPEAVETMWVGDPSANPADEEPLPQPYEEFEGQTGTVHILERPYVIDELFRQVKVWAKRNGDWGHLTRGPGFTLDINEVKFNLKDGYSAEAQPGGLPGRNARITINLAGLPAGTEFRIEYDCINAPNSTEGFSSAKHSYCPNFFNTELRTWISGRIEETVQRLQPKYIHFGHDEPWQMHTCRLCNTVGEYYDDDSNWISPNGHLFGSDVNYLNEKYQDYCEEHIPNYDGSYRSIIFADHVCYEHEGAKSPPFPMDNTIYGGGGGPVYPSRYVIDKSVIMNDWNYTVNTEANYHDWQKYQYIGDLAPYGFDVIGGSIGWPDLEWGDDAISWSGTPDVLLVEASDQSRWNFPSKINFEGSYQHHLPLCNKSHPDDNGRAWFSREHFAGGGVNHVKSRITVQTCDEALFLCNIKGRGASGTIWVDDVELYSGTLTKSGNSWIWGNESAQLIENNHFETLGSGGAVFANWDNPTNPKTTAFADSTIYRYTGGANEGYSCKVTSSGRDRSVIDAGLTQIHDFNPDLIYEIDPGKEYSALKIAGYIRTAEVDTYRLVCPWQWMKSGGDNNHHNGKYLGGVNLNFGLGNSLPFDEQLHIRWRDRAADMAVAEWGWGFTYPATAYLKNIWWDPFIIMEKEVSW